MDRVPCYMQPRSGWTARFKSPIGYAYVDSDQGTVCLDAPPPDVPACSPHRTTDCAYRRQVGTFVGYEGREGAPGRYVLNTEDATRANEARYLSGARPRYEGPLDGAIGSADMRTLPNIHVGALPLHWQDRDGSYNERLLSRRGGGGRAPAMTSVHTDRGFNFYE